MVAASRSTPPAWVVPSQASGLDQDSARVSSLAGMVVRQAGDSSGEAAGAALVAGPMSFLAAAVKPVAKPSMWLMRSATVNSVHGVRPVSWSSVTPASR